MSQLKELCAELSRAYQSGDQERQVQVADQIREISGGVSASSAMPQVPLVDGVLIFYTDTYQASLKPKPQV